MSALWGSLPEHRFVYRVPGPVPEEVRAQLDRRYGAHNWFSAWEEEYKEYLRRRATAPFFVESSHVFNPYIPKR